MVIGEWVEKRGDVKKGEQEEHKKYHNCTGPLNYPCVPKPMIIMCALPLICGMPAIRLLLCI